MATIPKDGNTVEGGPRNAADSARIGWAFLSQFFSFLNKDPARLHCFYTKRSTMIHSTEGEEPIPCYGQQEIHHKIMSLGFEDCKVYISNVDSQSSAEGGIIVQVIGEMSNAGGPWRKFAQTFFLAEQPNGYFVLNDICRYLKEEGDEAETTPAVVEKADEPQPESHVQDSQSPAEAAPPAVDPLLFNDSPIADSAYPEPTPASEQDAAPAAEEPVSADASNDSFTFHTDNSLLPPATNGISTEESAVPEPVAEGPVETVTKDVETAAAPPVEAEKEDVEEQPTPAPEPVEEAPTPAAPAPVAEPVAPSPPAPTPAAAPAAPAAPAPPAGPKTWASLAASSAGGKWSQVAKDHKGVSAAAPPPVERAAAPLAAPAPTGPPLHDTALAATTPSCFVKGVVETVSDKALRDVLTSRFGPLKEVDIVRGKACAFIEFLSLDSARHAIQASLRQSDGGDGGIFIDVPGQASAARINVVERKPHNERPVSNRREGGGGAPGQQGQGQGQGARTGRGGASGARGGRGGRGGAKAGGAPPAK